MSVNRGTYSTSTTRSVNGRTYSITKTKSCNRGRYGTSTKRSVDRVTYSTSTTRSVNRGTYSTSSVYRGTWPTLTTRLVYRGTRRAVGEGRGVKMLRQTYRQAYRHTDPLTKWVVEELSLLKSFTRLVLWRYNAIYAPMDVDRPCFLVKGYEDTMFVYCPLIGLRGWAVRQVPKEVRDCLPQDQHQSSRT